MVGLDPVASGRARAWSGCAPERPGGIQHGRGPRNPTRTHAPHRRSPNAAVQIRSGPGTHTPSSTTLGAAFAGHVARQSTERSRALGSWLFFPTISATQGTPRDTGFRRADGFPGSHGPPAQWRAMVEERLTARHPWTPCDCWDSARHRFWAGGIPGTSWTIESDKAAGNPPGIHGRVAVVGTLRGLDFRRADGVPGSHGPPAEWRAMVEERLTAWHRAGLPRASILEPAPSGGGGCPERARAWQRRLSSVRCGALPRSTGSRR